MNEQAKDVLAQLMQRALDGVDAAVDFSQQQIPDVIQQLLMWKSAESLIYFSFGIIFVLFCPLIFYIGHRLEKKARRDYENGEAWTRHGGSAISSVTSISYDMVGSLKKSSTLFVVAGFIMVFENLEWLQIWMAPKLYLLEYGASLIK